MSQILVFPWKTFGSRPGRRAHLPRKSLEDVNYKKRNSHVLIFQNWFTSSRLMRGRRARLPGWLPNVLHGNISKQNIFHGNTQKDPAKADQMSTRTYLFRSSGFMQEASKLEHIFKVSPSRTTVGGIYSSHSASAPCPIFQCWGWSATEAINFEKWGEGVIFSFPSTWLQRKYFDWEE